MRFDMVEMNMLLALWKFVIFCFYFWFLSCLRLLFQCLCSFILHNRSFYSIRKFVVRICVVWLLSRWYYVSLKTVHSFHSTAIKQKLVWTKKQTKCLVSTHKNQFAVHLKIFYGKLHAETFQQQTIEVLITANETCNFSHSKLYYLCIWNFTFVKRKEDIHRHHEHFENVVSFWSNLNAN